jgi:CRP/FNR family cyclic AMP-dependent transcriptional regulator
MEPTECAVLTRDQVRAFLAENPDFAFDLLTTVIRRAREATEKARGLAQDSVYARLKAFLEREAVPQADSTLMMQFPMTQQEIAGRIGCGREMVSRVLKELETGGYVARRERRIVVLKKLPARW